MTPKSQNELSLGTELQNAFRQFAKHAAEAVGAPAAFFMAVLLILLWAGTGPLFRFSDTWQLVVNTATTIITFLMVFLIQNTQNRDSRALHLKLDELIKATARARNSIIDVGNLSDEQLKRLEEEYQKLCIPVANAPGQKREKKS